MEAEKKLFESKFSKKLMEKTVDIINKWNNIHLNYMENDIEYSLKNIAFDSVGTIEEQLCFKKAEKFLAIQTTIQDIKKVFIFLNIDFNEILHVYPEIDSQESYFKYHVENYIIRIYTIIDLVGKLGNLLYQTGIKDEDCNCYKFKERIKEENAEISDSIEDILKFVEKIKKRRHNKIHNGKIEIVELSGVSFWQDYSEFLPPEFDFNNPILKSINENNFNEMIENLHTFLNTIVEKVNVFLDKSLNKI